MVTPITSFYSGAASQRIAGTAYSSRQAAYLRQRYNEGLTRNQLRLAMQQIGRGLPNAVYAELGREARTMRVSGERLLRQGTRPEMRGKPITRLSAFRRQTVAPRNRFVYTFKARLRSRATGEFVERWVRFGADQAQSMEQFMARTNQILTQGDSPDLQQTIDENQIEGLSVVEYEGLGADFARRIV